MNESPLKKYFEPSAFKKTIAKNAGIDPIEPTDKEKKMRTMRKDLKTGMIEGAAEAASQTMRNQIPKLRSRVKQVTKPNPNIHTGPRDFEPAWEGADISEKRWNSMSQKEKDAYTERYGD